MSDFPCVCKTYSLLNQPGNCASPHCVRLQRESETEPDFDAEKDDFLDEQDAVHNRDLDDEAERTREERTAQEIEDELF